MTSEYCNSGTQRKPLICDFNSAPIWVLPLQMTFSIRTPSSVVSTDCITLAEKQTTNETYTERENLHFLGALNVNSNRCSRVISSMQRRHFRSSSTDYQSVCSICAYTFNFKSFPSLLLAIICVGARRACGPGVPGLSDLVCMYFYCSTPVRAVSTRWHGIKTHVH